MLGALAVADGRLTVVPDGGLSLGDELSQALHDVVRRAQASRLTFGFPGGRSLPDAAQARYDAPLGQTL